MAMPTLRLVEEQDDWGLRVTSLAPDTVWHTVLKESGGPSFPHHLWCMRKLPSPLSAAALGNLPAPYTFSGQHNTELPMLAEAWVGELARGVRLR